MKLKNYLNEQIDLNPGDKIILKNKFEKIGIIIAKKLNNGYLAYFGIMQDYTTPKYIKNNLKPNDSDAIIIDNNGNYKNYKFEKIYTGTYHDFREYMVDLALK